MIRLLIIILFSANTLFSQSRLLVYSENYEDLNCIAIGGRLVEQGLNYSIFHFEDKKNTQLNVFGEKNWVFKKQIKLIESHVTVYACENNAGEYRAYFRGNYSFKGQLPVLFKKVDISNSDKLISLNNHFGLESENISSNQIESLIKAIKFYKINCHQLSFIFSKIENDSDKLRIFENSIQNLVDIKRYEVLLTHLKNDEIKNSFIEIANKHI